MNRKIVEELLVGLAALSPEALATLRDNELEPLIVLLAEANGMAGRERSGR